MSNQPPAPNRQPLAKRLRPWLLNGSLLAACFFMLYPVFSTLLLSVKEEGDVRRRPPILLPCDTETQRFDPLACRFSLGGYERVLLPQPAPESWFNFRITGRLIRQYLPNTLIYATFSALLPDGAGGAGRLCRLALSLSRAASAC